MSHTFSTFLSSVSYSNAISNLRGGSQEPPKLAVSQTVMQIDYRFFFTDKMTKQSYKDWIPPEGNGFLSYVVTKHFPLTSHYTPKIELHYLVTIKTLFITSKFGQLDSEEVCKSLVQFNVSSSEGASAHQIFGGKASHMTCMSWSHLAWDNRIQKIITRLS